VIDCCRKADFLSQIAGTGRCVFCVSRESSYTKPRFWPVCVVWGAAFKFDEVIVKAECG
jgi:hypothetical protein